MFPTPTVHTHRMDVMPDRDEQFRQFQADEIRRQTVALEAIAAQSKRSAADTSSIKALLIVCLVLLVLSGVISVVAAASA